jgi:hypothetical protein
MAEQAEYFALPEFQRYIADDGMAIVALGQIAGG